MILQIAPEAPWYVHAAANSALVLHIGGGAMGIASGWVAMTARKGGRAHRVAGTVFFVSMLSMTGVGAIVAPMLPEAQWTNTTAAVFTLYLVLSGWMSVQRPAGQVGRFERTAVLVPVGIAAMAVALGLWSAAAGGPGAFSVVFVLAAISAIAAAYDLQVLRAGGIAGPPRIARHLWRMGLAAFVANGSYFLGQPQFVPEILKDTGLNIIISVAVLALTLFWLVRIRWPRGRRRPVAAFS